MKKEKNHIKEFSAQHKKAKPAGALTAGLIVAMVSVLLMQLNGLISAEETNLYLFILAIPLLIATAIIIKIHRCPNCKKYMGRDLGKYCPNCATQIQE